MPWVRIHDGAISHPKIVGLSDKAFRLWIWGLSYSQQHLTDGVLIGHAIPRGVQKATDQLVAAGLWDTHPSGYTIHDYLDWNDSRETVTAKREGAKARFQGFKNKRVAPTSTETRLQRVASTTSTTLLARSGVGKSGSLSERECEGKPDAASRAGRLREELYPAWYSEFRHGAKVPLIANSLELADAERICATWDDARIAKLAKIVLTTDDEWISKTDRGFRIFTLKAQWADERLSQWERQHGVKA